MSDIEKPVEAGAAANGEAKSPTFLDKLSRFTIGRNRGELPSEKKGMWMVFLTSLGLSCKSIASLKNRQILKKTFTKKTQRRQPQSKRRTPHLHLPLPDGRKSNDTSDASGSAILSELSFLQLFFFRACK